MCGHSIKAGSCLLKCLVPNAQPLLTTVTNMGAISAMVVWGNYGVPHSSLLGPILFILYMLPVLVNPIYFYCFIDDIN